MLRYVESFNAGQFPVFMFWPDSLCAFACAFIEDIIVLYYSVLTEFLCSNDLVTPLGYPAWANCIMSNRLIASDFNSFFAKGEWSISILNASDFLALRHCCGVNCWNINAVIYELFRVRVGLRHYAFIRHALTYHTTRVHITARRPGSQILVIGVSSTALEISR